SSQKEVMLKDGSLGQLESLKDGIAKINVGGQIKHRKLDEIEQSPIPEPELADLYEKLTNAIPESARSSVINFAGYDANVNELAFRPHNGSLYVYKDIP